MLKILKYSFFRKDLLTWFYKIEHWVIRWPGATLVLMLSSTSPFLGGALMELRGGFFRTPMKKSSKLYWPGINSVPAEESYRLTLHFIHKWDHTISSLVLHQGCYETPDLLFSIPLCIETRVYLPSENMPIKTGHNMKILDWS